MLGVMRIVGGTAKGRRLAVPGRGTRPTSDRAREALFNTLRTEIALPGARVLDLYAGSGAVGLEALSQGAALSVMVESERGAAAVIENNIAALGLPGARLHRCPVATYLAAVGADDAFDVVYLDPPYAVEDHIIDTVLQALVAVPWIVSGGVVVVERSARNRDDVMWPDEIKAIKHRRYGEAALWYGRRE